MSMINFIARVLNVMKVETYSHFHYLITYSSLGYPSKITMVLSAGRYTVLHYPEP